MSGWSAQTDLEKDRAGVAIGSGIGDNYTATVRFRTWPGVGEMVDSPHPNSSF